MIAAILLLHSNPSAGPGVYQVGIVHIENINPLGIVFVLLVLIISTALYMSKKSKLRKKEGGK